MLTKFQSVTPSIIKEKALEQRPFIASWFEKLPPIETKMVDNFMDKIKCFKSCLSISREIIENLNNMTTESRLFRSSFKGDNQLKELKLYEKYSQYLGMEF